MLNPVFIFTLLILLMFFTLYFIYVSSKKIQKKLIKILFENGEISKETYLKYMDMF
jgi:predicted PurR-regulated permease PerM